MSTQVLRNSVDTFTHIPLHRIALAIPILFLSRRQSLIVRAEQSLIATILCLNSLGIFELRFLLNKNLILSHSISSWWWLSLRRRVALESGPCIRNWVFIFAWKKTYKQWAVLIAKMYFFIPGLPYSFIPISALTESCNRAMFALIFLLHQHQQVLGYQRMKLGVTQRTYAFLVKALLFQLLYSSIKKNLQNVSSKKLSFEWFRWKLEKTRGNAALHLP